MPLLGVPHEIPTAAHMAALRCPTWDVTCGPQHVHPAHSPLSPTHFPLPSPLGAASGILGDTSHLEGQTDNRLQVGENHSNHLQGNLSVSLTRNLSPRYLSVFKPYAPRLPLTELLNLKEQLWMPPCLFQTSPPQNYPWIHIWRWPQIPEVPQV